MSNESPRDRSLERLLATMGRADAELTSSIDACPDASELAAWADRTLAAAEEQRIEQHLASCDRCQAVLASFAGSAPVAAVPAWRRWPVLLPAALATAAAALIWIAWPRPHVSIPPDRTVARVDQPTPRAPEPATPAAPAPSVAAQPQKVAPPPSAVRSNLPASSTSGATPTKEQAATAPRPPVMTLPPATSFLPPPPTGVATFTPPAAPPSTAAQGAQAARSSAATSLAQSKASTTLDLVAQGDVLVTFAASTPSLARGGGGGGRGASGAAGRIVSQQGTQPVMSWRVLKSGAVERSPTGGLAWEPVTFDPPVPSITNGTAPDTRVCWLVGRGGAVLVTTDGQHFTRVNLPVSIDLIAVRAINGLSATVTTIDGRAFTTTDGGKTWLQGFHPAPF